MKIFVILTLLLPSFVFAEDFTGSWEVIAKKEEDSCGFLKNGIKEKLTFKIKQNDPNTLEITDVGQTEEQFIARAVPGFENNYQGEKVINKGSAYESLRKVHFWKNGNEVKMWRTIYISSASSRKCKIMMVGKGAKRSGS